MLPARHSSAQVRSVITITGLGDHDQPDWLITMTGIRRHEALLEGAIAPAAYDPNIPHTQPIAQLRQDAEFVIAPVDSAAWQHISCPTLPDETGRRRFRQAGRRCTVHGAQHVDGTQQRRSGRYPLEGEGGEEGR